jgi:peroxiredoxin
MLALGVPGPIVGLSAFELVGLAVALLLAVFVAGTWFVLVNVLRMNGRILERLETLEGQSARAMGRRNEPVFGLPVGSDAPDFRLPGVDGEIIRLGDLVEEGRPVVLIFLGIVCDSCETLLPNIGRWQRERADLTIAVISDGGEEANRARALEHGMTRIPVQTINEVSRAYMAPDPPSAVVVTPQGIIASPVVTGVDPVLELMARTTGTVLTDRQSGGSVGSEDEMTPPGPGDPAPEVDLADSQGGRIRLSDFRGRDVVMLFWDGDCTHCQDLLPLLHEWERTREEAVGRVLIMAGASKGDGAGLGLRSPIAVDAGLATARRFGVTGSPMAVLVDAEGRVASEVVVGAGEVMGLLVRAV